MAWKYGVCLKILISEKRNERKWNIIINRRSNENEISAKKTVMKEMAGNESVMKAKKK